MEVSEFVKNILDPETASAVDLTPRSSSMVVALAGGLGRVGMPMEVFADTLTSLDSKRVFLRDPQRMYYLFGLPEIGSNLAEIAGWLKEILASQSITHLTMFGNCMGAHAAIILGVMVDADVIHAFYPKTTIKWHHRLAMRDIPKAHIPRDMILRTNFERLENWKYLDLKVFLRKNPQFAGKIHVYADPEKRLTMLHAARLQEFSQVIVHTDNPNKTETLRSA